MSEQFWWGVLTGAIVPLFILAYLLVPCDPVDHYLKCRRAFLLEKAMIDNEDTDGCLETLLFWQDAAALVYERLTDDEKSMVARILKQEI